MLEGKRVVVVGGSAGIGLAVAGASLDAGGDVAIGGRSQGRLDAAGAELGTDRFRAHPIDVTDEASIDAFFALVGRCDHLVVTAATSATGPFRELPLDRAQAAMEAKFWGAYRVARCAEIVERGSVTFVSGILSRRPRAGAAALSGVNAALEALGRALAVELAPIRVNTVSPGLIEGTEAYAGLDASARAAMFTDAASKLPAGRVGRPQDIAAAILTVMTNPYVTGAVVDVDGGALLA